MVTTSMAKRLFALASVSGLTGLVAVTGAAGCTSEKVETTSLVEDAGAAAADTDAIAPSEKEPEKSMCYKEDPFDATALPYKRARVQPGKCSENVTKVIDALIASNHGSATFDQVRNELASKESQNCADCVFGPDGDSWPPIVMDGNRHKEVNLGGCVEVVSGSEQCGRAYQQFNGCLLSVCKNCSNGELSSCAQGAQATACLAATQALFAACGQDVSSYIDECFHSGGPELYGPIVKLCVGSGTAPDAGSDAASN